MINRLFFPTISNSKLALIILLFGLFAGILIRMAMIFFFIEFDFTTGDAASYIEIARHISEFGIYGLDFGTLVYRPPMYPFFLASIMFFFGNSIFSIQIIQIIISLSSGILITRIVATLFPKASPWVFFFAMVSPFESVYSAAILSEILASFFLVLAAFFLLTFCGLKKWILGGVALGLCCLTRDIYLLLSAIIVLSWLLFGNSNFKQKIFTSLVLLFSMFLVISPWTIHNYYKSDDLILVSKGRLGFGLWVGTWAKDWKSYKENELYSETRYLLKLGDNREQIFREKALERIKKEPLKVLKTYLFRSPLLWLGTRFDIFTLNKEFFPRDSKSWYLIKVFFYGVNFTFIFLSFIGIILIYFRRNSLLFLTTPLIYTALIYMPLPSFEIRYSQPVYPFILIFAGVALSMILKRNLFRVNYGQYKKF